MNQDFHFERQTFLSTIDNVTTNLLQNHELIQQIKTYNQKPITVLLETIPEDDLEETPNLPNVFRVKEKSKTHAMIQLVSEINNGLATTTLQKYGQDSFDSQGQRTKKNHSLVILNVNN
jgi:hypothetical protein